MLTEAREGARLQKARIFVEAAVHHASSVLKLADYRYGISIEVKLVEIAKKQFTAAPELSWGRSGSKVCEAFVVEMKWLPRIPITLVEAVIDLPPMLNNGLPLYVDVDAVAAAGGF